MISWFVFAISVHSIRLLTIGPPLDHMKIFSPMRCLVLVVRCIREDPKSAMVNKQVSFVALK